MNTFSTGIIQKYIDEKKLMMPLWIAYPYYSQYSMAWRMGSGDEYASQFFDWFSQFSAEDQELYQKLFPTPVGWYGWWSDDMVDDPTFYNKGKLFTGYWEPTGKNEYSTDWLNHKLQEETPIQIFICDSDVTSSMLPSGWVERSFIAPARDPERTFYSVMEFVLECMSLYFDDVTLNKLIYQVYDNPDNWNELKHKIFLYNDEEWNRILPGLLSLGFYYQITQNEELRGIVLRSHDKNAYVVSDDKDSFLCGTLSEDKSRVDGKNLIGFSFMNARDEIYKIYKNVGLCVDSD